MTEIINLRTHKDFPCGIFRYLDLYIDSRKIYSTKDMENVSVIGIHRYGIEFFIDNILSNIDHKINLVIANSDHTFPIQVDKRVPVSSPKLLEKINGLVNNKFINKLFVENLDEELPNTESIPCGVWNQNCYIYYNEYFKKYECLKDKELKVSYLNRNNRNHIQFDERRNVYNLYLNEWKNFIPKTTSDSIKKYKKHISDTKKFKHSNHLDFLYKLTSCAFTICVHGGGLDYNPKLVEAIMVGVIPIIRKISPTTDLYEKLDLPVVIVNDWNKYTITCEKLKSWYLKYSPYFKDSEKRKKVLNILKMKYWVDYIYKDFPDKIRKYPETNNVYEYIQLYPNNNISSTNRYRLYLKNINQINLIKINFELNCYINNTDINTSILKGNIYHKIQLENILDYKINLYYKNKIIYFTKEEESLDKLTDLKNYVDKYIYSKTFDDYISEFNYVSEKINTDKNILILLYINDIDIANIIFTKINNYRYKNRLHIGVIFNNNIKNKNLIYDKIKIMTDSFTILTCKEYGNGTIPTLILYNHLKSIDIEHIIKIPTTNKYLDLSLKFLLDTSISDLDKLFNKPHRCINTKFLYKKETKYFKNFDIKYNITDHEYIYNGIFYTKSEQFDNILNFIKIYENYRTFFVNNMYDPNLILLDNNPIHYLDIIFCYNKF